jgi:hypothetical protein
LEGERILGFLAPVDLLNFWRISWDFKALSERSIKWPEKLQKIPSKVTKIFE